MAIADSPETVGITGTSTSPLTDSDLTHTLRRRPAAATTVPRDVADSGSKTADSGSKTDEDDSTLNDLVRDSGSDDSVTAKICEPGDNVRIGGSEASMDSVNAVQDNKGLGENDRGGDRSAAKFAYRPSVPAHRRVKESPLSSDAIFRQVFRPYLA